MTTAEKSSTMYVEDVNPIREEALMVDRIAGDSLVPVPGAETRKPEQEQVKNLIHLLESVDIPPSGLQYLETFEEVLAAVMAWKYKTMVSKQKDYGPENIAKAGEKGLITRTQDKLERLKVLVGDSDQQVDKIKTMLLEDEPETLVEMNIFLNRLQDIVEPEAQNESVLDTYGDLGNYGDIGVILHTGAWGKPLDS